jgi:hypothetical protein
MEAAMEADAASAEAGNALSVSNEKAASSDNSWIKEVDMERFESGFCISSTEYVSNEE